VIVTITATGPSISPAVPMSERDTDTLFDRVSDTIYATLYGNFATSLVQGVSGLMFWWLWRKPGIDRDDTSLG
jgi:predicted PurR-regulated permease PerM